MASNRFFVLIFSIVLSVFSLQVRAQQIDFENYRTILSSGNLPKEFSTNYIPKFPEQVQGDTGKESKEELRIKHEFYLQSAFQVDNVLRSGKVLFNDPVGIYVNKVFDNVLKENAVLRKEVKVFVVKTRHSNAFATDNGIIFVTTGLLARLKNEAQLAFVLCHELTHYIKKHNLQIFIKNKVEDNEEIKKEGAYDNEPELLSHAAYSKEKETEADSLGLELYIKSGYAVSEAISTFNVLHYSYLPIDSIKVTADFFDTKNIIWPKKYFKDSIPPVFSDENEEDSSSTHPNTYKRKLAVTKLLEGRYSGGKLFLVSETEFNYIRKICKFEYCRQLLLGHDYFEAVYVASAMQKEYPENKYLKKVVAKSFLGVLAFYAAGYKNKRTKETKKNEIQGDQAQVNYFFSRTSTKEVCILATEYAWKLKQSYPEDGEVAMIVDKCFLNMAYIGKKPFRYFYKVPLPDSLRQRKMLGEFNSDEPILRYAYADYLNDSSFVNRYAAIKNEDEIAETPEQTIRKKRTSSRKLRRMDGKKIVFLSPFHYFIDTRYDRSVKIISDEKDVSKYVKNITIAADAAHVPYELLTEKNIDTSDASKLNNLSLLKDWLRQTMIDDTIQLVAADYAQIQELRKIINSDYLCLLGNIHVIEKKRNATGAMAVSILFPVISWPFTISYLASKQQTLANFMLVLDLETGRKVSDNYSFIRASDTQDINLSTLYDFMLKVKAYQLEKK